MKPQLFLPTSSSMVSLVTDWVAVIQTCQELSDELIPPKLIRRLMQSVMLFAQAQSGMLLLEREGQLWLEATAYSPEKISLHSMPIDACADLPRLLIERVMATQQVIDDTHLDEYLLRDPYFRSRQAILRLSMLCVPLLRQHQMVGILYLEHAGGEGFPQGCLEAIQSICAQAAISLRTAWRYMTQQQYLTRLEMQQNHHSFVAWLPESVRPAVPAYSDYLTTEVSPSALSAIPELAESIQVLESTVNQIETGVMIVEVTPGKIFDSKIVYVNAGFTQIMGYAAAEAIGKTPRMLDGPKTDRAQLSKIRMAVAQRQPLQIELLNYRKDGSEVWVEVEIAPIANSHGTHWLCLQRNINARKQLEEALWHSERMHRAFVSIMPDLIVRVHRDGTYLDFIPPTGFKSFTHTIDLRGRTIFEILPAPIAQQRMCYIRQALQTHETQVYQHQIQVLNKIRTEEVRIVALGEDEVLILVREIDESKAALG